MNHKALTPSDRTVQLERIAAEIDRTTEAYVQRILLLNQQRRALTETRATTEAPRRLVKTWERGRAA